MEVNNDFFVWYFAQSICRKRKLEASMSSCWSFNESEGKSIMNVCIMPYNALYSIKFKLANKVSDTIICFCKNGLGFISMSMLVGHFF